MTTRGATRLSRTTLFVPASRPDMIPKAAASAADAVCLDLEDAVAPNEKAASRAHVVPAGEIHFGKHFGSSGVENLYPV